MATVWAGRCNDGPIMDANGNKVGEWRFEERTIANAVYQIDEYGEAVNITWVCSPACAVAFTRTVDYATAIGQNPDALPGTVCESCGKLVGEPE